jgi:carboxyl-terminal processing protease
MLRHPRFFRLVSRFFSQLHSSQLLLAVLSIVGCAIVLMGLGQPRLAAQQSTAQQLIAQQQSATAVFDEVWRTVNEKFYDPNFNGVDWPAMRDTYRSRVAQTESPEQAAVVINQMLAELNTSHTRFYTPEEPAYYQLLGVFLPRSTELQEQLTAFLPDGKSVYSDIGIFTQRLNNQVFIKALLDESPAATSGLQVGDELLSVDGQPFHPIRSFVDKADQPVTVTIRRSPNSNPEDITVTPKRFDATTMFLEAQTASTQVIEQDGKSIGYVHIWSYAGDQYHEQLQRDLLYGDLKDADALVLDLREGWGGASTNYLNLYNQRNLSLTSIPRNGVRYTSGSAWTKPVVLLVNEGSRSGKEILAYGFQQLQIGPVVGSKTAGAVVAGSPFLMQDGSLLYVAVTDVYLDNDFRLEGVGVTPDVEVPFALEYAQGADPQKEQAIVVAAALVTR